MSETVEIEIDGRRVAASTGCTVAAVLLDHGVSAFRASVSGEPRGPLCGMGICHECRVTIDGVPHRRACLVPVVGGMRVATASPTAKPTTSSTTRPTTSLTVDPTPSAGDA